MRPPLFLASIAFFLAAIASGVAEKIFYGGRIDENGVLQESFFLPLTFIFFGRCRRDAIDFCTASSSEALIGNGALTPNLIRYKPFFS